LPRPALAALLALPLLAATQARAAARLPWYGDYLETTYMRTLAATKSPWRAGHDAHTAHIAQMLSVQPQRDGRRLTLTYDWQTQQAILLLQRDGAIRRELAWGSGPNLAVRLADATTICLTTPRAPEHCYQRVGNAQAYITRIVLGGAYTDRDGAAYRFGNDGVAQFAGESFRFALMLDQSADPYDFFQIGADNHYMAFRHDGGATTLFAVAPSKGAGYGHPDFAHPLAVLRPAGARRVLASN
jgi:hypothetical protein